MCERLAACAILAMLTAGSGALAADVAVPMRKSAAPSAYDWTGIYLGGHFGAGFSYRNWTLADGATAEAGDAAMVGGQIGLNYQLGKWVVGAEGGLSWGNLKDESVCPDGTNT
jgi:outer membrane immunogenic protein